ncbi:MAG: hypothetical protein AAGB26_12325 [Planctomycetota bacterium]
MAKGIKELLIDHDNPGVYQLCYGDHDCPNIFSVDWRADETEVVDDCATCLGLDSLSAEWSEDGESVTVSYNGTKTEVPNTDNRYAIVIALNQLLQPEYEIRYMVVSHGTDTACFAVLTASDWNDLDAQAEEAVKENFIQLEGLPNIFTELIDRDLPLEARELLKRINKPKKKWWWPF